MTPMRMSLVVETAIVTFGLLAASESLITFFPGLTQLPTSTVATIRVAVFAILCIALGYWTRRRLSSTLANASAGFALGVILAFTFRSVRAEAESGLVPDELAFTLMLALANWIVLLAGAFWAERHQRIEEL